MKGPVCWTFPSTSTVHNFSLCTGFLAFYFCKVTKSLAFLHHLFFRLLHTAEGHTSSLKSRCSLYASLGFRFRQEKTPILLLICVFNFSFLLIYTPRSLREFSWITVAFLNSTISAGTRDLWFRITSILLVVLATNPLEAMNLSTWSASFSSLNFTS
jgi:hypothetical protein